MPHPLFLNISRLNNQSTIAKSPPHTRYMAVIGLDSISPANQIANEFDTKPRREYILGVNYGSDSSIVGPEGLEKYLGV